MTHPPLKRILGTSTALLIGIGVAIGSGIFRTPGEVAGSIQTPWIILLAWVLGGVMVLTQGLVTAELATRFPEAGGEYVYLREAYGEFVAFFFGWAYTVFIIGGGAATISLAFGDFACELIGFDGQATARYSSLLAAAAVVVVVTINAIGLRAGAGTQNVITAVKILALAAVAFIGLAYGHEPLTTGDSTGSAAAVPTLTVFLAVVLSVRWSYDGTTDAVKLAEEVRDVRRALPRAVIGSALALLVLYVAVNAALLRVVPAQEMTGLASVPGEAARRVFGPAGRTAMLLVGMFVCLGSLASTLLATVRVTFALARDGLTFRILSRMSKAQSPVAALVVVAGCSLVLVLNRNFRQVLSIYYFASAILFGMSYASLIVFRLRDRTFPANVYRCPIGMVLAVFLILVETVVAVTIAVSSPRDTLYTVAMLVFFGVLYFVWKRFAMEPVRP